MTDYSTSSNFPNICNGMIWMEKDIEDRIDVPRGGDFILYFQVENKDKEKTGTLSFDMKSGIDDDLHIGKWDIGKETTTITPVQSCVGFPLLVCQFYRVILTSSIPVKVRFFYLRIAPMFRMNIIRNVLHFESSDEHVIFEYDGNGTIKVDGSKNNLTIHNGNILFLNSLFEDKN